MALKTWTTNSPTGLDTTTEQPTLTNYTDRIDATHVNTMSTALRSVQAEVGSDSVEAGSLLETLNNMQQRSVKLAWSSVTLINVTAWPGESSTVPIRLQDGTWRSFTGTLTFNPAVTGEGGLDTGVEANVWYYLYLVPTAADDSLLCVRGSTTSPTAGGPSGYSNYRYIGAVRNASGNLLRSIHISRQRFLWTETKYELSNAVIDAAPVLLTLAYSPATALSAEIRALIRMQNTSEIKFHIWVNDGAAPSDLVATTILYMFDRGDSWDFGMDYGTVPFPVSPPSLYYKKVRTSGTINWGAIFNAGWTDAYL